MSVAEERGAQTLQAGTASAGRHNPNSLRWCFVGMITLSTIINVIDCNTLANLVPAKEFGLRLSPTAYSWILAAYYASYTLMYTGGGWFVDRVGERLGMGACILWTALAGLLHSLASGPISLGVCRLLLGMGAPGNYPGALRVCTVWFNKQERGLPIAIFSSSSSIGGLLAVPLVAWLALHFGWRSAFIVPGLLGVAWVAVWALIYRSPSAEDRPDKALQPVRPPESPWQLLKQRNVLAIVGSRLVSDPVYMFYLSWTPTYLATKWGYDLHKFGQYGWIPFVFAGAGGLFAGTVSDWLIRRGLPAARARKVLVRSRLPMVL